MEHSGKLITIKTVIPAKAGIQKIRYPVDWMPAFEGMTENTPLPFI